MNRVLILVSGGVAEVIYADRNTEVVIFDEDNKDDFGALPSWAQEALIENEEET